MTIKICARCGCGRVTMIKALVQEKIDSCKKLDWLCFPCFFKIVTNSSLQIVDEDIYHDFMSLLDERQ